MLKYESAIVYNTNQITFHSKKSSQCDFIPMVFLKNEIYKTNPCPLFNYLLFVLKMKHVKKQFHILYDIVVSGASINVIIDKLK